MVIIHGDVLAVHIHMEDNTRVSCNYNYGVLEPEVVQPFRRFLVRLGRWKVELDRPRPPLLLN